jgi:hypothetical protein
MVDANTSKLGLIPWSTRTGCCEHVHVRVRVRAGARWASSHNDGDGTIIASFSSPRCCEHEGGPGREEGQGQGEVYAHE